MDISTNLDFRAWKLIENNGIADKTVKYFFFKLTFLQKCFKYSEYYTVNLEGNIFFFC